MWFGLSAAPGNVQMEILEPNLNPKESDSHEG
jgi:hypothetical protein